MIVFFRKLIHNISFDIEKYDNKYSMPFIVGSVIFVLSILFLEIFNQPFYFAQDDSFHALMPTMIYGCKSFFETGNIAEVNPFQFACYPLVASGTSALLYPLTYISYLIAKFIFTECALADVFSVSHLFIAYCLSFFAAKGCKVKPYLAVIFALSYTLSGYSLTVGRSWMTVMPCIAYSPIIIISINQVLNKKQNLLWALTSGICLALLFLAGHVQMWCYTMIFFVLSFFIFFILQKITLRQFIGIVYPVLICFVIILPQLYVSMDLFEGMFRPLVQNIWPELKDILLSLFFPSYIFGENFLSVFKSISFSGGVFQIFFAFVIICLFFSKFKTIFNFIKNNPYFIIAIVAILCSLGDNIGLFPLMNKLPFFKTFKWAHKLILFMNLFINLQVVIWLSKLKISDNKSFKIIFPSLMFTILFFHLCFCDFAFFKYPIKPYPKEFSLIADNVKDLDKYRILKVTPYASTNKFAPISGKLNFATYYGLYSIDGYNDFLISCLKYNRHYDISKNSLFGEYSVKYIFFEYPQYQENDSMQYHEELFENYYTQQCLTKDYQNYFDKNYKKVFSIDRLSIYDVGTENCRPFAFENETGKEIPLKFNCKGASLDTSSVDKESYVTVCMQYYPNYYAFTEDNQKVDLFYDDINRIVLLIKPNTEKVNIIYISPWHKGALFSVILIFFIVCIYFIQRKYFILSQSK